MTAMIEFTSALLQSIAAFLGSEPIIYLFSVVILCFLCKAFRSFLP